MWLFLKNLAFTVFIPGTVAGYIPYRIVFSREGSLLVHWSFLPLLGLLLFLLGASIYFWCLWDFAVAGRGTPAPIDAPKRLVARGLYRYVRNPMYFGVLFVILGWAALYRSPAVLGYALLVWGAFHLFVVFIEEPALKRQFGEEYEAYCRKVRRWAPGWSRPV